MTLRCFVNCPAYRLTDEAHSGRAQAAAQALAGELGWQCTFAASLSDHHGIGCWPSREQRLSEALQALEHEFWWPARGGYGCTELAAELLPSLPARTTLIGYSDITALHAAWIISDSCESIYAMMPGVSAGQRAHQSLTACLSGSALSLSSATTPGTSLRRGTASGPIFAACLRVLASLVGGPLMPELRGRILAIEDIDERAYAVDRDLRQLHLAGCLEGITGLVGGAFPCDDPEGYAGPGVGEVLEHWASTLGIPAMWQLPFGHDPDPLALINGRQSTLTVGADDWTLVQAERG